MVSAEVLSELGAGGPGVCGLCDVIGCMLEMWSAGHITLDVEVVGAAGAGELQPGAVVAKGEQHLD